MVKEYFRRFDPIGVGLLPILIEERASKGPVRGYFIRFEPILLRPTFIGEATSVSELSSPAWASFGDFAAGLGRPGRKPAVETASFK